MKQLMFADPLPELIIAGKKTVTWRINDKKDINVGGPLSLYRNNGNEFARAEVTHVKETVFGRLTKEDKNGHEKFSSDEEIYQTYSHYYDMTVTPETPLKMIRFSLRNI